MLTNTCTHTQTQKQKDTRKLLQVMDMVITLVVMFKLMKLYIYIKYMQLFFFLYVNYASIKLWREKKENEKKL